MQLELEFGFEELEDEDGATKMDISSRILIGVAIAILLFSGITYGSYRWVIAPPVSAEKRIMDNRAMPHFPLSQYLQELDAKRKTERDAAMKKLRRHGGIDRATCAGFVGNRTCQIYL